MEQQRGILVEPLPLSTGDMVSIALVCVVVANSPCECIAFLLLPSLLSYPKCVCVGRLIGHCKLPLVHNR